MALSPRFHGPDAPVDRIVPENFDHIAANPLDASTLTAPKPVSIGVNWYTSFDSPVRHSDGSFHLPDSSHEQLGSVRGGHCVCLGPLGLYDTPAKQAFLKAIQTFYNQGQEGACEGFGHSHAASIEELLVHGRQVKYDAFKLYDDARRTEGTYPSGEGATNHGAVQAMQTYGLTPQTSTVCTRGVGDLAVTKPVTNVAWTQSIQQVLTALDRLNAAAVPLLNSWGTEYPEIVWLPVSTLERLLSEEGEADCTTDA